MKHIENRISNLIGRYPMQWEEEQTPLFVCRFPKLLRILLQKLSDLCETHLEYCRVRLRSMSLPLFFLE